MPYSDEQLNELLREKSDVLAALANLCLQAATVSESLSEPRSREHMQKGACARLYILRHSIENIFRLFPPSTAAPLASADLLDVQINLHAFVINLYGFFENLAWVFILRHGLESNFKKRNDIGLFLIKTQTYLPEAIRDYLQLPATKDWHTKYLKNYRDALAHRIPLYIPPKECTPDEFTRFAELESQKIACGLANQWEMANELKSEQDQLGSASFEFRLAVTGADALNPILLHLQIISDAKIVVEFGNIYLTHFHECAQN